MNKIVLQEKRVMKKVQVKIEKVIMLKRKIEKKKVMMKKKKMKMIVKKEMAKR